MFDLNSFEFSYEKNHLVDVDFLLPNGFFVTLQFPRNATLSDVKEKLWSSLGKFSTNFKSPENYTYATINQSAEYNEFFDTSYERLCDLNLLHYFFKVIEIEGNKEEKHFNGDISKALGFSVEEFNLLKDDELINYRLELFKLVRDKINEENSYYFSSVYRIKSFYTQNVEIELDKLSSIGYSSLSSLNSKDESVLHITVYELENGNVCSETFWVSADDRPVDIIKEYFRLKLKDLVNDNHSLNSILYDYVDTYVLNVCGCNDVIFGDEYPIKRYKYVIKCQSENKIPCFFINTYENLIKNLPYENATFLQNNINKCILEITNKIERKNSIKTLKKQEEISWNVNKSFQVYLDLVAYLPNLIDCDKLFFRVAIYLGQEQITQFIDSKLFDVEKTKDDLNLSCKIDQTLDMGIQIKDLHRCCKLCVCLNYVTRKKKETIPFAWISFNLFDYEGNLLNGKKQVYMWDIDGSNRSFQYLCQFHATGFNPSNDYVRLKIEFPNSDHPIAYPNKTQIENFLNRHSMNYHDECFDIEYIIENDNKELEKIIKKDQLAELTEQDKKILWRRRLDCVDYPFSINKLLQAVKWNNQVNLIEMYELLFKWPDLKPTYAIELLTSIHADIEVRKFAVNCLSKNMKNEELELYLIQLVQALKNEPYFTNPLAKFLLNRAFESTKIGFALFWNLKTEMKNPKYKYKFGILIEAFCRGLGGNLKILLKQVDAIEKLASLTHLIKNDYANPGPAQSSFLNETLKSREYKENLDKLISPLNLSIVLGEIDLSKTRVLSSAKRPLYLTWDNKSEFSHLYEDTFELIFKNGDDLRQDMLTIQALKLINIIWMNEGLDLKMLIYDVNSTGPKVGFIEVIKQSLTIFKIQTEGGSKGKYQIDTDQLYRWICMNNPNEKLPIAIDNFTKSCAGFCVATYILGIGDRHPDNIMVNKEGKLFHIDFGHFLGHFKKKLGFKRERVPFVLTEDFTKVISKGSYNSIFTEDFHKFKELCEVAYMTLRKYSNLLIDLFVMMLSSGMPELQSTEDIMYLRNKLAIDDTDAKALEYFRSQFDEACRLSFTTKFDWVFHALNKSEKIASFRQLPHNLFS